MSQCNGNPWLPLLLVGGAFLVTWLVASRRTISGSALVAAYNTAPVSIGADNPPPLAAPQYGYPTTRLGPGFPQQESQMVEQALARTAPPLNPVLTQPLADDLRQTCSGYDYYPAYEGILDPAPSGLGPGMPPARGPDGGAYHDGNYYGGSGACYQHNPAPPVFPRNWQVSGLGGWWPANYNGGVLLKPANFCGSCTPTYDNLAPWALKQR